MTKIEIDINKKGERYDLDINGVRVLASDNLGELIDRIEREVKKIYGIKTGAMSKIGGFFNK